MRNCSSWPARVKSHANPAVEFAQKHNIPFEVRSSFSTKPGTEVKKKVKSLEDTLVSGVAIDKNQVRVA